MGERDRQPVKKQRCKAVRRIVLIHYIIRGHIIIIIYVYIYHSYFIYSSVDGHLGCFYVLAIINNEHRGADIFLN